MKCKAFEFLAVPVACLLVCVPACVEPSRPLPYVAKPAAAGEPLVCHDGIGHVRGNKPWILGGNCCCTPTRENYNRHVADGTIEKSLGYVQYLRMYSDKGIVTDLDHRNCGNLCPKAPHVTLGGKCMATPTPGAWMYERVTYGPHGKLKPDELTVAPAAPETAQGWGGMR